jgi:hypothetical protein
VEEVGRAQAVPQESCSDVLNLRTLHNNNDEEIWNDLLRHQGSKPTLGLDENLNIIGGHKQTIMKIRF